MPPRSDRRDERTSTESTEPATVEMERAVYTRALATD